MLSDIFHRVDLPPKADGESSQGTIYHGGGVEGGNGVVVTRGVTDIVVITLVEQ